MKLHSKFAVIAIERGRKQLDRMIDKSGHTGAKTHDLPDPIPVVIHGWITGRTGYDDGESQEFSVDVTKVEVGSKS